MRRNRVLRKRAIYYITATINRDKPELEEPWSKEMLLTVLKQAKKKFKFNLVNFVFLYTHIHLIIKPKKDENLSRIMQWVLGTFAVRYNKRLKIRGKVWFDRFKSEIVEKIEDFVRDFQRVNDNLVKNKLTEKIKEYIYCGMYYHNKRDYQFMDELPLLLDFLIT